MTRPRLFEKFLRVVYALSLEICLSNLKSVSLTVLEVSAFNSHFKLVRLIGPLHTHTTDRNTDTSNEHITSAIHFVHLAEITTLSTLHSEMNCGRSCYIIYHLASNLLPHYLAKFTRSTVQLYSNVNQFKTDTKLSIYSKYLPEVSCSYNNTVCIQNVRYHVLSRAHHVN